MGWKERLGIANEYIFDEAIDDHFKKLGFKIGTMSPGFLNGREYNNLSLHAPALRLYSNIVKPTTKIFMNTKEIYIETETSRGTLENTWYKKLDNMPSSARELEELLDSMIG